MQIEQAIRDELADDVTLGALVGGTGDDARIDYDLSSQGTDYPYVSMITIDGDHDYTHEGADGWRYPIIQISIFSKKYMEGKTIKDAILGVIDGWSQATMQGAVYVGYIFYDDESDNGYDHNTKSHHLSIDFKIAYCT